MGCGNGFKASNECGQTRNHSFNPRTGYALEPDMRVGGGVFYTGERRVDDANMIESEASTAVDVFARSNISDRSDVLAGVTALLLAHAGLTALALAMDRHYRALRATRRACPPQLRHTLRGALALCASLGAALRAWPPSHGAVAWFGLLTVAALALVLALAYRPRFVVPLAIAAASVAVLMGATALLTLRV